GNRLAGVRSLAAHGCIRLLGGGLAGAIRLNITRCIQLNTACVFRLTVTRFHRLNAACVLLGPYTLYGCGVFNRHSQILHGRRLLIAAVPLPVPGISDARIVVIDRRRSLDSRYFEHSGSMRLQYCCVPVIKSSQLRMAPQVPYLGRAGQTDVLPVNLDFGTAAAQIEQGDA
ncbi:hypothetical protein BGX30_009124, partial [Mortierella sp. GBA39]